MKHKTAAVAEALRREQRMTLLLRHLLRGTTGVGESFFCGLAKSLTAALGVRFAFISVREGDWTSGPPMLRLLAFFERGEMLPTFRYDTRGTPCARVIDGCAVRIQDEATAQYPDDEWFTAAGIRGYQAVPIILRGAIEGHLGIADDKPLEPNEMLEEVLVACADRCAAELDRIRLTEQARRLEEQYRHAHKMEAVGRLAGGIAHDFNNMLTVIMNNAELVFADMSDDHPYRESIAEIMSAGSRSADLTNQLLAFSRKDVFTPRILDLRRLIDGIRPIIERLIGDEISINIVHPAELWPIRVDAGRLEQVVFNLATNACDAMPAGGQLTLESANVVMGRDDDPMASDELVKLSVIDTGCGMSAELRERIFEPFFTTKSVGQGTGLGLALVYGFIERNGGRSRSARSRAWARASTSIFLGSLTSRTRTSAPTRRRSSGATRRSWSSKTKRSSVASPFGSSSDSAIACSRPARGPRLWHERRPTLGRSISC